jgi:hypothetical protein
MPCADSSTICARRQVTTDPLPQRMIRTIRRLSSSSTSRTRSRSVTEQTRAWSSAATRAPCIPHQSGSRSSATTSAPPQHAQGHPGGLWAAADNIEIAYTPTNSSRLNRMEAQFTTGPFWAHPDRGSSQLHTHQRQAIRIAAGDLTSHDAV